MCRPKKYLAEQGQLLVKPSPLFLIASPFFLFILDDVIFHRTLFPSIVQYLPFTVPVLAGSRLTEISTGQNILASNALFFFSGFNDVLVWNVASVYLPFGLLTLPPFVVIGIYCSVRKRQVHANLFLIWLVATIPLFFLFPLNINRVNAIFIL